MKNKRLCPEFSHSDVEILGQVEKHQGFYSLSEYRLRFRQYDGQWSLPVTRELFQCRPACGVLLYDPDQQKVVLVEQFRLGTFKGEKSPWSIELVAGMIDEGETPEEAARREVLEESGFEVEQLLPICNYWPSPGGSDEYMSLFCARVDASIAGGIYGALEEDEDILVRDVPVQEAFEALSDGVICNAQTIIALQWLQLNREKIHQRWLT